MALKKVKQDSRMGRGSLGLKLSGFAFQKHLLKKSGLVLYNSIPDGKCAVKTILENFANIFTALNIVKSLVGLL
jgi:hypothetical protein